MLELTIYYKIENVHANSIFIKKTGVNVLQVTIDNRNGETQILASEERCNLESFLVCPVSDFNQAFTKAMLKCEAMKLFPLLGLDMSQKVEREVIQRTTDVKVNTAQQYNQGY